MGNRPNTAVFPKETRIALLDPVTPVYDGQDPSINNPFHNIVGASTSCDDEDMVEEDQDDYSWNPSSWTCEPAPASGSGPAHRRSKSTNELSLRNARKAHTVVERSMSIPYMPPLPRSSLKTHRLSFLVSLLLCRLVYPRFKVVHIYLDYRDRLNDKIADLGLYLFQTSSDCKHLPSRPAPIFSTPDFSSSLLLLLQAKVVHSAKQTHFSKSKAIQISHHDSSQRKTRATGNAE